MQPRPIPPTEPKKAAVKTPGHGQCLTAQRLNELWRANALRDRSLPTSPASRQVIRRQKLKAAKAQISHDKQEAINLRRQKKAKPNRAKGTVA